MAAPRKPSAMATGGRMLNPSVEPAARRESAAQARRNSEGKARQSSAAVENPHKRQLRSSAGGREREEAGDGSSVVLAQAAAASATSSAALEARNQRRSVGLKRLSLNGNMKEKLINALEGVAKHVAEGGTEKTGIETLQNIMTEAKEKGLGVSKLFQFFLLHSDDGAKRESVERQATEKPAKPEDTTVQPKDHVHQNRSSLSDVHQKNDSGLGGVFKDTLSSKTRAEASRSSRGAKKKSQEIMPSLQKKARPSTASSKRASGSEIGAAHGPTAPAVPANVTNPASSGGISTNSESRKSSMSRRSSFAEEASMRDRLITSTSFQQGLATLGFRLGLEETTALFGHLDTNGDGMIDLAEFTRFCLEIPSMAWKAERARRGVLGIEGGRELDKAASDMANETLVAGSSVAGEAGVGAGLARLGPVVDLGNVVFKGEKFFWRTKDLIQIVIQLNETKGFLAVSTFHTERLEVFPVIFVDLAKIPLNATAVAEILDQLKTKKLAAKTNREMAGSGVAGAGEENASTEKDRGGGEEHENDLSKKAHLQYMANYIVHRITMPDNNGNLLQPDLTRPEEQVNPDLPEGGKQGNSATDAKTRRGSAVARPGLMKTTFDEWDTLLFPKPPARFHGAPEFPKTKKRESYFQEFLSVTGKFDENRVKAHRLSEEADFLALQVAKTLAPLSHSASAPAPAVLMTRDVLSVETSPRLGSGRLVLADDISAKRGSAARKSLLESQSAPALRQSLEAVVA